MNINNLYILYMFCESPNASPQNFVYSGLPELQSLLNEFSITFNPNQSKSFNFKVEIVGILQEQDGNIKYKSRDQFNEIRQISDNQDILALQEYPYKVVSATYGCNHDFFDTQTARLAFSTLQQYWYPNFNTLDTNVQQILKQFEKGVNITNTSSLDNIWEKTQQQIDTALENVGMAFPTINILINRTKPNSNNAEEKQESKSQSKNVDLQNIGNFLSNFKIDNNRIVWVIDTFQSWLEQVSPNKLNLSNSIAVIDGATTSVSGAISGDCANLNQLQVGPFTFINNTDMQHIEIYKLQQLIGRCAYGASVTTIVNLIYSYGRNLTGASRSNIQTLYQMELDPKASFSAEEMILIAEFVKAAGDQAPVDICKQCLASQTNDDDSILIFSTGDLLAYQMAKSLGLAAFFISSSKILFTIPTSVVSLDLVTPTLTNFTLKFQQMIMFYKNFNKFIENLNKYLNILSNFSAAGQITGISFSNQIISYLNKVEKDTDILLTAYQYLIQIQELEDQEQAQLQSLIEFYNYIKNNINNINFSPDQLYDFLFASKSDEYEAYTYTNGQFNMVELNPNVPPENDDDNFNVVTFCDNLAKNDCVKDSTTYKKDSPVKYIQDKCQTDPDPKCSDKYARGGLIPIPNPVPKNYVYKNLIANEGQIDEGWLLVGEIVIREYQKNTTGQYQFSPENLPIPIDKPQVGIVPLSVLENVIQSTLVDLLWQIPYNAFNIPMLPSGQPNIKEYEKKLKYIVKTLQLSLQDLLIDDFGNTEAEIILYLLFAFSKCPPVAIDEQGNAVNEQNSNMTSNKRASRGRAGVVSSNISHTQGKQMINQFILVCTQIFNIEQFIGAVILMTDETSFSQGNLQQYLKPYIDPGEAQQFIDTFYEQQYNKYLMIQNDLETKMNTGYQSVNSQLPKVPTDISVLNMLLDPNAGGRKKTKRRGKKNKKTKRIVNKKGNKSKLKRKKKRTKYHK
jgi:hypothetical protein